MFMLADFCGFDLADWICIRMPLFMDYSELQHLSGIHF